MEIQFLSHKATAMSSVMIAELTGKSHNNVMRDIRQTLTEAGIGLIKFESSYLNSQNKEQPCFHLPRFECDLVVSGYSVKYRAAIIRRWHELETQAPVAPAFQIPETMADALRLAADSIEQLEKAKLALADAATKLVTYNAVMATDALFGFRDAAAMLAVPKLGGNNLVLQLLKDKILYRDDKGKLRAYRTHIENGRFKAVEQPYQVPGRDEHKISFQIKLTQVGLDWLAQRYGKESA